MLLSNILRHNYYRKGKNVEKQKHWIYRWFDSDQTCSEGTLKHSRRSRRSAPLPLFSFRKARSGARKLRLWRVSVFLFGGSRICGYGRPADSTRSMAGHRLRVHSDPRSCVAVCPPTPQKRRIRSSSATEACGVAAEPVWALRIPEPLQSEAAPPLSAPLVRCSSPIVFFFARIPFPHKSWRQQFFQTCAPVCAFEISTNLVWSALNSSYVSDSSAYK